MQQQPDLTPGFQIPQANHFIPARGEHRLSVCQQADCGGAFGVFTEDEAFLALALTPQVTPLPASEIRSSRGNEALTLIARAASCIL